MKRCPSSGRLPVPSLSWSRWSVLEASRGDGHGPCSSAKALAMPHPGLNFQRDEPLSQPTVSLSHFQGEGEVLSRFPPEETRPRRGCRGPEFTSRARRRLPGGMVREQPSVQVWRGPASPEIGEPTAPAGEEAYARPTRALPVGVVGLRMGLRVGSCPPRLIREPQGPVPRGAWPGPLWSAVSWEDACRPLPPLPVEPLSGVSRRGAFSELFKLSFSSTTTPCGAFPLGEPRRSASWWRRRRC